METGIWKKPVPIASGERVRATVAIRSMKRLRANAPSTECDVASLIHAGMGIVYDLEMEHWREDRAASFADDAQWNLIGLQRMVEEHGGEMLPESAEALNAAADAIEAELGRKR